MKLQNLYAGGKKSARKWNSPCFGLRIGNGSPNFQKKYMNVNHTTHAKSSFCLCTNGEEKGNVYKIGSSFSAFYSLQHFYIALNATLRTGGQSRSHLTELQLHLPQGPTVHMGPLQCFFLVWPWTQILNISSWTWILNISSSWQNYTFNIPNLHA